MFALLHDLNAAGVPWGIVTNGPSSGQHMTIRARGLEGLTEVPRCLGRGGLPEAGPRDIPGRRSTAWELPPGRDVLFVGDDVAADMVGAKGVGLSTAWVTNGQSWPSGLEPPDHEVGHVSELRPLLLGV